MLYTSWAERVMADDESVSHIMVFQMGPIRDDAIRISQHYKIHQNNSYFFPRWFNQPFESSDLTSAKNIFSRVMIKCSVLDDLWVDIY